MEPACRRADADVAIFVDSYDWFAPSLEETELPTVLKFPFRVRTQRGFRSCEVVLV
jgi:hypothetical protein